MRVGARVGARVWVGVRAGARVRCGAGGPQARRGGGLVQAALAPLEQRHEQRLVPRAGVGRRLLQGVDVLDGAHQHDGAHGDDGVGRRDDQVAHAEALVSAGVGSRCRVVGAWAEGWWSAGECRLVRPCLLWVLAVGYGTRRDEAGRGGAWHGCTHHDCTHHDHTTTHGYADQGYTCHGCAHPGCAHPGYLGR